MLNTCFTSLLAVSADNLALGGQVVLIGLGTVFSVLILLWLCLELLHFLLNIRASKADSANKAVTLPAPAADAIPVVTESDDDEDEIAAVIAAAVYAAQADAPHSTFRAVSFKRIH